MPVPIITAPPSAPQPTDSKAVFNTRAFSFFAFFAAFVTELNAALVWLGLRADETAVSQGAALASENAASASANAAQASANQALGASAYKGEWATLTGALNLPASVRHLGQFWILNANLADVTTAVPGVSASWVELTTITPPVAVIAINTTAVRARSYVLTASLILTLPASPAAGDWVAFSNRSGTTTAVIARNGQNIMGLAEDMTLDNTNHTGRLVFADATRGWVFL